ncbi:MAG: hypothetical protein JWN46_1030 [Acidimicrobiales bacterium]|nr:hypothetical protein [Acidimicrobiales bacterium]
MRRTGMVVACAAVLLGSVSCSKGNSVNDDRKRLVDELVKAGRSRPQSECIVSKLDDQLLKLMRAGKPPPVDSPAFKGYSASISRCVAVK